jgi:hypothetical protein
VRSVFRVLLAVGVLVLAAYVAAYVALRQPTFTRTLTAPGQEAMPRYRGGTWIPDHNGHDTAFLRNPRYHTIRETAETLDYGKMARVVDGVLNATVALSRER